MYYCLKTMFKQFCEKLSSLRRKDIEKKLRNCKGKLNLFESSNFVGKGEKSGK